MTAQQAWVNENAHAWRIYGPNGRVRTVTKRPSTKQAAKAVKVEPVLSTTQWREYARLFPSKQRRRRR